jgi:transposase
MKKSSRKGARRGRVDVHAEWPLMNADAAGIDLGAERHYVAVPEGRGEECVRSFGCYTVDLLRMVEWLKLCGVKTVAMESTGVYWVPVFEVLEDAGFEVLLVDARKVKNVSGRKSDVSDCQWIQRLHSYGLLSGAFRPSRELVILRSYWRHREGLVQSCSQQIHLMQKALEQMNVQLHKAVTDITGVTGLEIIRRIVTGLHDPQALARLRRPGMKSSQEEIAQALTGNYREEHIFALRQALEAYDFFQRQIERCDREVERYMGTLPTRRLPENETSPEKSQRGKRRKNQPHFDLRGELHRIAGVDLCRIPGIDALTAQKLVTECGVNMALFPAEGNFASWLHICPNNRKTGGVVRSRRTRRGKSRAATALCVAAQTLFRSKEALGHRARQLRARLGAPKAVTAMAHHLARLVYRLLKYGHDYVEKGQQQYEAECHQRAIAALRKRASAMGFELVNSQSGEILAPGRVS